mmetsp:Transcript_51404/g.159250  ORF Transcript_51404/g.159250 Transcript_51404/m.159250 type:complete len:373 (-) Transcript_51404:60-1178(-)
MEGPADGRPEVGQACLAGPGPVVTEAGRVAVCPQGHELRPWQHKDVDFDCTCDLCDQDVDFGSALWGCRVCDWDICAKCHLRLVGMQTTTVAKVLELRVNTLEGSVCTLAADPSWRVGEVKVKIAEEIGVPPWQQRLLAGIAECQDIDPLSALPASGACGSIGQVLELTLLRRSEEEVEWLRALRRDGELLQAAPQEFRDSSEAVLSAVQESGHALRHAQEALRADPHIAFAAVQKDGLALAHVAEPLRADRAIVLAAVSRSGIALRYAAQELQADRDVVLAAVRSSGSALEYASGSLRADREVVLQAIQQWPDALQHAAAPLRADREVVLAAVRADARALQHAHEELQEKYSRFLPAGLRGRDRAARLAIR